MSTPPQTRRRALMLALSGVATLLVMSACSSTKASRQGSVGRGEIGMASYYGNEFQSRKTANGERFDQGKLTAAHKKLPFGTRVRVTNRDNGRSVVVRINDRGPFVRGRIIDLSSSAFKRIASLNAGVVPVRIEIVD